MKTSQKLFILFAGLIVAVVLAVFGMYGMLLQPKDKNNTTTVNVVIPKGASARRAAELLKEKDLIHSPFIFRAYLWQNNLNGSIQAGTFHLNKSLSVPEIVSQMIKGTDDAWVTFLEGWRREEIADELSRTLGESFDTAEFLELTKDKEGYLFPDTYLLPKTISAQAVVNLMTRTFDQRITDDMKASLAKQNRTLKDAVILASLVEREARTVEAKKMVAGILWQRLDADWPLQVDATLQYARGYDKAEKTWWPEPLAADKTIKSLYNTYLHTGLPVGPIANPGLQSIEAAINPKASPYWYYITDPQGNMHYAETIDQHNANVQKYLR